MSVGLGRWRWTIVVYLSSGVLLLTVALAPAKLGRISLTAASCLTP